MSMLEVSSAKLLASQVPLGTSWNWDFRLTVVSRPKYHRSHLALLEHLRGIAIIRTKRSHRCGHMLFSAFWADTNVQGALKLWKIIVDSLWVAFSESAKHCIDMLNECFIQAFALIHQCLVYMFFPSHNSYCKDPCPKDNTYTYLYIRIYIYTKPKFGIHSGTWCHARFTLVQTRPSMDSWIFGRILFLLGHVSDPTTPDDLRGLCNNSPGKKYGIVNMEQPSGGSAPLMFSSANGVLWLSIQATHFLKTRHQLQLCNATSLFLLVFFQDIEPEQKENALALQTIWVWSIWNFNKASSDIWIQVMVENPCEYALSASSLGI